MLPYPACDNFRAVGLFCFPRPGDLLTTAPALQGDTAGLELGPGAMAVAGTSNSASQNLFFFPVSSRRTLIPTCQSILHRHGFGKARQWYEQRRLSLAFSSVKHRSGIEHSQELSTKGKGE